MTVSTNPGFDHAQPTRAAVVLVNLGSPDAPESGPVRRYLAEFLSDRRVIERPRWQWWPILHGIILRVRPARTARLYRSVWTAAGSPLVVVQRELAQALESRLATLVPGDVRVRSAMRYGAPALATVLDELRAAQVGRILIVPMYPQYSGTTTGSVFDALADTLKSWRWIPEIAFVSDYHRHPAYIDALAASVRDHWAERPRGHLLFSFHGIPERYFQAGDPYFCHCQGTARRVAERLGLGEGDWSLSFQSRVGRERWLAPYTDEWLDAAPTRGIRSVDVICPGFAVDCLETLEEIAVENRQRFLAAGGERFDYIPALNVRDEHVAMLAQLVRERIGHWPECSASRMAEAEAAATATDARQRKCEAARR